MKTVDEYVHLPYHIVLTRDEDEEGTVGYVAQVQELPGCISQGDTPDEAVESVQDAMVGWITVALEDGKEIPEPAVEPQYSGKFLVRGPKSLHAALTREAELEGVSLNQFVVCALSAAVEWRASTTHQAASPPSGIWLYKASVEAAINAYVKQPDPLTEQAASRWWISTALEGFSGVLSQEKRLAKTSRPEVNPDVWKSGLSSHGPN